MKNIVKYAAIAALVVPMTSCDDLFEPAIENIKEPSSMATEANYADQILGSAYILMPYPGSSETDVATDDAVSNDNGNAYRTMCEGWTSRTGVSVNNWRDRNASIQYVNLFLENVDKVPFSSNETINNMFRERLKGEAYGLRALNMYYLLQNYAGEGARSGEILGVPIWTSSFSATSNLNVPRATFKACVDQVLADCKAAIELLPTDYVDLSGNNALPAKYKELGVDYVDYNRVNGASTFGRVSGRIVEALRAQVALLAASPAFEAAGAMTWAQAADYAAVVLDYVGGVDGLSPVGHKWYTGEVIGSAPSQTSNIAELIWRDGYSESSSRESDNFPPSIYGKGRVNPTQNLVDAFPTANGYPISDSRSNYDAANPYANRDPRLETYIVVNGSKFGVNNSVINTGTDSPNNDGINKENGYSTRTGYYMRKHLRGDVNPNSSSTVNKYHCTKRIRYTEIFLAYAEAANEAWGPTGKGSHGYSAYDVIKAIRYRAGIGHDNNDAYLESVKGDKAKMRELIRNERRLELCFENVRFWDLRRWKAALNEPAKGVEITGTTYKAIKVDDRNFKDYMIYGPLPNADVLKFSELEQNKGW